MENQSLEVLRVATGGSVDDGKSTLIGRLLLDREALTDDQIEYALKDLAFTDGLKSEAEQKITIDVAYRYFNTSKCRVILADAPGHFEYTRNMATAASTADALLLLIDASRTITEQTKRHLYLASILSIPRVIFCINKMDLVSFAENRFNEICERLKELATKYSVEHVTYVPISALCGDNVVKESNKMPWYKGQTLIELLNQTPKMQLYESEVTRAVIQAQCMDTESPTYQVWLASGQLKVGDEVLIQSNKHKSKIAKISTWNKSLLDVRAPAPLNISFEEEVGGARGLVISKDSPKPQYTNKIKAILFWMGSNTLNTNLQYDFMHTCNLFETTSIEILSKFDINQCTEVDGDSLINTNDICTINLSINNPITVDCWKVNRTTGSFILIDRLSKFTVAAGIII